jgi:hypothetical protein
MNNINTKYAIYEKKIKKSIFHSRFKVRVIQGPEFGQLGWHSDFEGP